MNFAAAVLLAAAVSSPGYVLHEWGTFTSVAGEDGKPIIWKPLAGPSDLPSFVYTTERFGSGGLRADFVGKGDMRGNVRMETPVIYFYAQQPMEVSLSVGFTGGTITEWYPFLREYRGNFIDWGKFKLVPGTDVKLPKEAAPSHYYPAREVDAVPVRICSVSDPKRVEHEKFLFYRGVGTFDIPVTAKVNGDQVEVTGLKADALVFENKGGKVGVTRVTASNGASQKIRRPALERSEKDAHALVLELLISAGLYEKEAKAMVETWRDTWFEEGLRVMYLVPRNFTDAMLPLQASPAPTQSVRVLVGRFELLTKERVAAAKQQFLASKDVSKLGRFGEPLLKRARLDATPAEQKLIDEKLNAMPAVLDSNTVVQ